MKNGDFPELCKRLPEGNIKQYSPGIHELTSFKQQQVIVARNFKTPKLMCLDKFWFVALLRVIANIPPRPVKKRFTVWDGSDSVESDIV
jgi:hypothetical protein